MRVNTCLSRLIIYKVFLSLLLQPIPSWRGVADCIVGCVISNISIHSGYSSGSDIRC